MRLCESVLPMPVEPQNLSAGRVVIDISFNFPPNTDGRVSSPFFRRLVPYCAISSLRFGILCNFPITGHIVLIFVHWSPVLIPIWPPTFRGNCFYRPLNFRSTFWYWNDKLVVLEVKAHAVHMLHQHTWSSCCGLLNRASTDASGCIQVQDWSSVVQLSSCRSWPKYYRQIVLVVLELLQGDNSAPKARVSSKIHY